MTDPISANPLAWPPGWPRTAKPRRAVFQVSFASARDDLLNELRLLGARGILLSTNVPLRRDGLPYAGTGDPADPAVAVYFDLRGGPRCLPCGGTEDAQKRYNKRDSAGAANAHAIPDQPPCVSRRSANARV